MNEILPILAESHSVLALTEMHKRSVAAYASAETDLELLDALDMAGATYEACKISTQMQKRRGAEDHALEAIRRVQGDSLDLEIQIKRRRSDEYDAARDRGEVQGHGGDHTSKILDENLALPSLEEMGLTAQQIHEGRQIRKAEEADPGIVNRTILERLEAGHEPTRAAIRGAISDVLSGKSHAAPVSRKNPIFEVNPAFDAISAITGAARRINDLFREYADEFIVSGFVDEAMKRREVATLRKTIEHLQRFLGEAK